MKKPLFVLVLIVLVGVLGWVGWAFYSEKQPAANVIRASGTVETTEIQVGSRIGGRILAILAKEGDLVRPGQLLVRLDRYQLPGQEAALNAQLTQAQEQLKQLIMALALRKKPRRLLPTKPPLRKPICKKRELVMKILPRLRRSCDRLKPRCRMMRPITDAFNSFINGMLFPAKNLTM